MLLKLMKLCEIIIIMYYYYNGEQGVAASGSFDEMEGMLCPGLIHFNL